MSTGFAIDPATVRTWKRYPAYKDSGVEWLGEVPAYWDGNITWFTPEDLGKNEAARITSNGR